jgi:hypothetical protein
MFSENIDITLHISNNFLSNKEKIVLSATSKTMNKLKYKFRYPQYVRIHEIRHLPYFDNFECVSVLDAKDNVPKNAKIVCYVAYDINIPSSVTHLYFFNYLDNADQLNIPQTVTQLTFGYGFNDTINFEIPTSVTHLSFDKLIKCHIPLSVTHLDLDYHFNSRIKNINIPQSVTHLSFGRKFNQELKGIPSTVIEIKLSRHYSRYVSDKIIKSKIKIKDTDIDNF